MKKTMNKKSKKILFFLPSLLTAIAIVPSIGSLAFIKTSGKNNIGDISINADTNNQTNKTAKPLVPSVSNMYNPKLSSKNGPIVFWKNKITSLDWFGSERWSIDVTTLVFDTIKPFVDNGSSNTSWKRSWLNFDLDKTNDILYILSNAKQNSYQYAVSINVQTGKAEKCYKTAETITGDLNQNAFFMLKVLNNGNLAFLGRPGNIGNGVTDTIDVVDIKTGIATRRKGNITNTIAPLPTATEANHDYSKSNNVMFNLIPIATNRNLLAIYNLTSNSGTTGDNGAAGGTSEVSFILVDDELKTIPSATNGWDKAKLVTKAIPNTRNSKTRPQCDYHVLLDGRVVTVIYDKLVVIDPTNLNNPTLAISTLDENKWIESWSFDSNESLFFKAKDDTLIKQVVLDKDRTNITKPNHVISPYYDLSQSPIQDIKDCAKSLVLYNVYGYIGQIMLVNAQFQEGIRDDLYANDAEVQQKKYGLAVAITNNKDVSGQGDTKGLLNTANAFQQSADFNISQEILAKKLPSEITKDDITFLNNSFLTQNNTKNSKGELLYPPFVKNELDDNNKTLKLTLNLDQIPWFVTDGKMPSNIVPLQITKVFTSLVDINSRFSWKQIDKDDYDIKNTLPSKITEDDINRVSPLVSTMTSQRTTINNVNYPNTKYTIINKNDTTGEIELKAEYKYLPMELKADLSNIKTYVTTKKFNIFKSTNAKKIEFVGGSSGITDISTVPELKEIKESDVLPSSFNNAPKQDYLKFIDTSKTTGYPLEKMKITAVASDTNGTLTISIDPSGYDPSLSVVSKTYTGLNKVSEYSLKFIDNSSFNKQLYLPSEINEEIFYQQFVKFSGFDASDFDLQLFPNDTNGSLVVNVFLNGDYPNGPTTNTDFKLENGEWVAKKTFSGFKNIIDYNKEYQLTFKKDGDADLSEIQKITPAEIQNQINSKKLVINNKTYTSIEQLSDFFISSRGLKIPKSNENNKNVKVEMFINNGGGEITWRITYSNLDGYPNPITFLETITGFAKGNEVPTNDVLTFCNTNQLKAKQPNYFNMLPSQIKTLLETNKKEVVNFFLNDPTGGYAKAIQNNEFNLEIIDDDNNGNLNIRIVFERTANNNISKDSLLEYNQIYSGLMFK